MPLLMEEFIEIMDDKAPAYLKESWDNVGLMVGSPKMRITSILVALDCTYDVIEEAISKDCNLIFTHHPLIFNKFLNINEDTLFGKKIIKLVRNNIAVYSAHTNLDLLPGGINDILCNLLGFSDVIVMNPIPENQIYNGIISSNKYKAPGIGRIVTLDKVLKLDALCELICNKLEIKNLRYVGKRDKKIHKIAIINGSGSDYFPEAYKLGVDCIISGDTKYHTVSDFNELDLSIIDVGHFETEWIPFILYVKGLEHIFKLRGASEIKYSEYIYSPYSYFSLNGKI